MARDVAREVVDLEDEAPPPPLSAAWASSAVGMMPGGGGEGAGMPGSGKKKGRKQGVTLLSNSGGHRR